MAEYIEREEAETRLFQSAEIANSAYTDQTPYQIIMLAQNVVHLIPAADVHPAKHGEWVKTHRHTNRYRTYTGFDDMGEEHTITVHEEFEYDWLNCPYCGASAADNFQNFCPNCGTDMRKERDNG